MQTPVDEELWNIFTYYSLHGTVTDPFHINTSQLTRLCKDCLLCSKEGVETPFDRGTLTVLVREKSFATKSEDAKRFTHGKVELNFKQFLDTIAVIGSRCYPSIKILEDAFERVLMDNILPFASRRSRDIMDIYIAENLEVATVMEYYEPPLRKIFTFYAIDSATASGEKRRHAFDMSPAKTATTLSARSPRKSPHAQASRRLTKSQTPPPSRTQESGGWGHGSGTMVLSELRAKQPEWEKLTNATKDNAAQRPSHTRTELGYSSFLRMMNELGLGVALQTTTYDMSHVFLTVMQSSHFNFISRNINFEEFCEVLVKLAAVGFRGRHVSIGDKTHALFMFLSRHSDKIIQSITKGKGSGTLHAEENATYVSHFITGIRELHVKFQKAWQLDDCRDYLAEIPVPEETSGFDMLMHLSHAPPVCEVEGEDGNDDGFLPNSPLEKARHPSPKRFRGSIEREPPKELGVLQTLLSSRPKLSRNNKMVIDMYNNTYIAPVS